MKNKEIIEELNAFMGAMREGDMRGVVASQQAAIEYLLEKVRIYEDKIKETTGKQRIELDDDEKKRLAQKGNPLNTHLLSIVEETWVADTVLGWYRKLIAEKYDSTGDGQKKRGRKPISQELVDLIVQMGKNNPTWGYKRIKNYLIYLGYKVSFMTVKRVLTDNGIYPPEDGRSNSDITVFYDSHRDVLAATDFCTYELHTPQGLQREHILFFENIDTREVWLGGIKNAPDGNWMAQIARNQADMFDGKLLNIKYLIHDRDVLFTKQFTDILKTVGCKTKLIAPRCPEHNGYMESFIKTFKTECLDRLILTNERQLQYAVNEFLIYYNKERPHSGIGGKIINPWEQAPNGEIQEFSRLGGLLKSYRRVAKDFQFCRDYRTAKSA